ncbi:acetoacetate-CoA ligase [Penicillium pulvis]|uniref:acetoacetate-CoA ligase n=1 Tax=Penicillium pulvis TaxID=1562058 RepID=UPI002546774F|nr:acetoacetate-CoA ligase [Penicillium pulvis]KAJ5810316.1 acetoacetate-CoA ligase [Penicillium pulvis]
MVEHAMPRKLWEHKNIQSTEMYKFMQMINATQGTKLETFTGLYEYSIHNRSAFYAQLFEWANIIHEGCYSIVVDEAAPIDSVPRWFSGVRLNWAENILYSRGASDAKDHNGICGKEDDKIAITAIREGNTEKRNVSWSELRHDTSRLASALAGRGVQEGDRVVAIGANSYSTLLVFLATTWLGAIFTSASTDMGVSGILQRAVQINPKASFLLCCPFATFVFFDDAAVYNGRTWDLREKMTGTINGLKRCSNFSKLIAIPRFDQPLDVSSIAKSETWSSFLGSSAAANGPKAPPFARIPFHAPFLICYSSGTTGIPKAIVHTVGGVILNVTKEERLHHRTSADTIALQFTTTSWIMYVLQVAGLLMGARLVLYDGSPMLPDWKVLVEILGEQHVTKFGTSPRWLSELAMSHVNPRDIVKLDSLQVVTSTGMPLADHLFEWVYDVAFPPHVQLINMSGGTDIAGCFGTGNPLSPVFVGGTQGPSLGVPIAIYDASSSGSVGSPVALGKPGELVATAAFVNMPCFFWGDSAGSSPAPAAPPGSRYHSSYFARFDHVWTHGDFCIIHPKTRSIHFMGRADGVLNPSGVRFGSSEIYAVVDAHFSDRITDSLCVGQRRSIDLDESVMLFVLMRNGQTLDKNLVRDIKAAIAKELSKRHVPKYIFEMPELPITVNHKKVELPVKQIVSGQPVQLSGTLLNPRSLEYFHQFVQVEELGSRPSKL